MTTARIPWWRHFVLLLIAHTVLLALAVTLFAAPFVAKHGLWAALNIAYGPSVLGAILASAVAALGGTRFPRWAGLWAVLAFVVFFVPGLMVYSGQGAGPRAFGFCFLVPYMTGAMWATVIALFGYVAWLTWRRFQAPAGQADNSAA